MKLLYDIECYYNYFCVGIKDYETKEIIFFEISEEQNDIHKIIEYYKTLNKDVFMISFNGIEYDNLVINYLLKNYHLIKDWNYHDICTCLKEYSDYVIHNKDNFNDTEIKKYKYHNIWTDIDLFKYWSKMIRISKKISLKSLGIQLNHNIVQELPFKPDSILKKEDLPKLRDYNINNDLVILEKLCDRMKPQILQRQDAYMKYGFNCWSWDGVKLGLNILLEEYCKEYGCTREQINGLRSRLEPIKLKKLLSYKISFRETEQIITSKQEKGKTTLYCNSFYTLYNHLKERIVSDTNELSYSIVLHGVKYDIKSGGLHSYHNPEIVEPDLDKVIYRDADVSSMYPTLGATYGFVPSHLPGMDKVIKRIKDQRIQYKRDGKKADAELYKLALNGG